MRRDLKRYLIEHVDIREFYSNIFDDYTPGVNVNCPFHSDRTPSMSIRESDGAIYCHACGAKASSFVGFYEQYKKVSFKEAMRRLWKTHIGPAISYRRISSWAKRLQELPRIKNWLADKRGINATTAKMFRIGWDGERITIPITNEYGIPINIRRYHSKRTPKILSYGKGYGGNVLFPIDKLREDDASILLVEGEWDAILAWQMGFNVLTTTSGATSWRDSFTEAFKGREVIICYDNDKAGRKGAAQAAKEIAKVATRIRIVRLPVTGGLKDLTDYIVKMGKTEGDLKKIFRRAEDTQVASKPEKESIKDEQRITVRIGEASKADLFYRPISTEAHVTGKRLTPYLPPKRVNIRCRMDRGKLCTTCHMLPPGGSKNFRFSTRDRRILGLIGVKDATARTTIRDIARIPSVCSVKIETLSTFNIEEITVTPPIDETGGAYTSRLAYVIGHGLPSNQSYIFNGYTVPHPNDQSATHIFTSSKPLQTHLDSYTATEAILKRLQKLRAEPGRVEEKFTKIIEFLSARVTKIMHRPLMHLAVDLAFHSPIQFYFNNEKVKKGYLEVAIIGDTRCGKGYVATELSRYYGVGEIATAENCSFAGLIGGITKHQNNYSISWGLIPRNNERLVIIDETSGLETKDLARMTRVRSEGIAEIFKIQAEITNARTRIIWLSNTRTGRSVNSYAYGVEIISELFGKAEDVSKLDYALVVRGGDVDPELINAPRPLLDKEEEYDRADFRDLIMWIWTRKPSQIIFTEDATSFILETSLQFGRKYHSSIPLVQVEDIRIKLARISAAVAARIFSTDKTGKNIIVTRECAEFTISTLKQIYDKAPTSYLSYSQSQYEATTISSASFVERLIDRSGKYRKSLITGLLETSQITITDISDFLNCDKYTAKEVIGKLVRSRCLVKNYTFYIKKPAFIELLRRIR